MKYLYLLSILSLMLTACSVSSQKVKESQENESEEAKTLLQGLWINEDTQMPLMRVEGDSIYYNDAPSMPVAFKIVKDTLKTYGYRTADYHIKKQSPSIFWIQSAVGDIIQLYKSDNASDSIIFTLEMEQHKPVEPIREVLKKDTVVYYNNVRYHGYVYINPTDIKVYQTEISSEGFQVDKVYYDQIIHICVYEGKNELYGKDIHKQDFESLIPAEYYRRAILSDMNFVGVDEKGYRFQAQVCVPNTASCYLIHLSINADGETTYELVQ